MDESAFLRPAAGRRHGRKESGVVRRDRFSQPDINLGWRKNSVKAGDEITMLLSPARNGRPYGTLRVLTFADGRQLEGVAARVGRFRPHRPAASDARWESGAMRTMHVVDGFLNLLRLGGAGLRCGSGCMQSEVRQLRCGERTRRRARHLDARCRSPAASRGERIAGATRARGRPGAWRAARAPAIRNTSGDQTTWCAEPTAWNVQRIVLSLRDPTGRRPSRLHPRLVPLASCRRSGRRRGRRPAAPAHDGVPGEVAGKAIRW